MAIGLRSGYGTVSGEQADCGPQADPPPPSQGATMATDVTTLPGTWNLDTVHSSAGFVVKHMVVAKFRGHFDTIEASLVDGVLTGAVKVDSLVVKDENLKGHLLSPDFFEAEKFPEITFKSTSIT